MNHQLWIWSCKANAKTRTTFPSMPISFLYFCILPNEIFSLSKLIWNKWFRSDKLEKADLVVVFPPVSIKINPQFPSLDSISQHPFLVMISNKRQNVCIFWLKSVKFPNRMTTFPSIHWDIFRSGVFPSWTPFPRLLHSARRSAFKGLLHLLPALFQPSRLFRDHMATVMTSSDFISQDASVWPAPLLVLNDERLLF